MPILDLSHRCNIHMIVIVYLGLPNGKFQDAIIRTTPRGSATKFAEVRYAASGNLICKIRDW